MSREDQHFRLRLPADLREKVEAAAAESRRSLTAEILARLEASFEVEKQIPSAEDAERIKSAAVEGVEKAIAVLLLRFTEIKNNFDVPLEDIIKRYVELSLSPRDNATTPSNPTPKRPSRAR